MMKNMIRKIVSNKKVLVLAEVTVGFLYGAAILGFLWMTVEII